MLSINHLVHVRKYVPIVAGATRQSNLTQSLFMALQPMMKKRTSKLLSVLTLAFAIQGCAKLYEAVPCSNS